MKPKLKWPLVWRKRLEAAIAQEKEILSRERALHRKDMKELEEMVPEALGKLRAIALTKHLDENNGRLRVVVEVDARLFRETHAWDAQQQYMARWVARQVEKEFARVKVLDIRDEWEERKITQEWIRKGIGMGPPPQPLDPNPPETKKP